MKKIFILAIIAVLGLAVASCKCTSDQTVQEDVVVATDSTVVDSTAVDVPVDSTLVVE